MTGGSVSSALGARRQVGPERRSVRPAEAAALLGVCRDTVYVLMRAGRLRSVKLGRARLIPVAAIEEPAPSAGEGPRPHGRAAHLRRMVG